MRWLGKNLRSEFLTVQCYEGRKAARLRCCDFERVSLAGRNVFHFSRLFGPFPVRVSAVVGST